MQKETDFLIIGSGLAGLTYALQVSEYGKVILITKSRIDDTNTYYAQGGVAAVTDSFDSTEKHLQDTLIAGDGLCNKEVVKIVVSEGPERVADLIKMGADFDKHADGTYDLAREGGHSEHRILHHKDNTGFEIQRALTEQVKKNKRIEIYENHFAVELITQHQLGFTVVREKTNIECYGAYVFDEEKKEIFTLLSKITFIATGGIGNIYQNTTNPEIATGDGIAMVFRAKGLIENMEFVQFHPTALYNPGEHPAFLITEAMRGFGAVLRTQNGKEFMHKYDSRKELAPRDIVARAIDSEMKITGADHVFLDCTHLDPVGLSSHFPNIIEKCTSLGINLSKDYIPVVPAAHYLCGGIKVNKKGRTSIRNLYAAGEATSTGLHGANRLASNSLLEALVYAERAARFSIPKINKIKLNRNIPPWNDEGTVHLEELVLITQEFKELQQIMSSYVGIVRSNLRLERALKRLAIIYRETEDLYDRSKVSKEICELRNAVSISYLVIKMAKLRKESRGLHYTIDYPEKAKIL
jgi:L-aspartate oxidase